MITVYLGGERQKEWEGGEMERKKRSGKERGEERKEKGVRKKERRGKKKWINVYGLMTVNEK